MDTSGRPAVSSSMRPGAPVAVAAMTARSAAATASRLAWRRAFFTDLKMPAVARRTATASGCSGGSDSTSASTCRHVLSLSGSIAFTVEAYGAYIWSALVRLGITRRVVSSDGQSADPVPYPADRKLFPLWSGIWLPRDYPITA